MAINEAGLALLKKYEGCRLKAYKDPVGILTIGYGHTSRAGPPMVRSGMTITQEEAERILATDLGKYEAAVKAAVTRPMNANQFGAMVSLCYNIGPWAFAKSSVARKFNAGDLGGAADAFLLWNKAGGRVLKGLVARRKAERMMFLTPAKPTSAPKPRPAPDVPPTPSSAPRPAAGPWAAIAAAFVAASALIYSGWEWLVGLFN